MKKTLAVVLMLALAGSTFAATASFNAQSEAEQAGLSTRVMFHPLFVAGAKNAGLTGDIVGVYATDTGYIVNNNTGAIIGLYLSESGYPVNDDLFTVDASAPYTVVNSFKFQRLQWEGNVTRLGFMATPNANFGPNRVDIEAGTTGNASYRGSHTGVEFMYNADIPGMILQGITLDTWFNSVWVEGLQGTAAVTPEFEFRGVVDQTVSQSDPWGIGEGPPAVFMNDLDLLDKQIDVRISWNPTYDFAGDGERLGAFIWAIRIEGDADLADYTDIFIYPPSVHGDNGQAHWVVGDEHVYTYRYRAAIEDFTVTVSGANVDALDPSYGMPSVTAPFFAE